MITRCAAAQASRGAVAGSCDHELVAYRRMRDPQFRQQQAGNLRAPHVAPVNALVDELINPVGRVRCYRHPDSDYGAAGRR